MKGAAKVSCYYPSYLGFPLTASASCKAGSSHPHRDAQCPRSGFCWRGSLPFIGLTLPWGHLAAGFYVRGECNPRNLADLTHFLPEDWFFSIPTRPCSPQQPETRHPFPNSWHDTIKGPSGSSILGDPICWQDLDSELETGCLTPAVPRNLGFIGIHPPAQSLLPFPDVTSWVDGRPRT